MSMSAALLHPWLAGSASQPSSSLPGLGGDSTWDVHEVGSDVEGGNEEEEDGWTRPGTASGTNMESGLLEAAESEEGFSQPMRGLDLNKRSPALENGVKRKHAFSSGSLSPPPAVSVTNTRTGALGASESPTKRVRRARGADTQAETSAAKEIVRRRSTRHRK